MTLDKVDKISEEKDYKVTSYESPTVTLNISHNISRKLEDKVENLIVNNYELHFNSQEKDYDFVEKSIWYITVNGKELTVKIEYNNLPNEVTAPEYSLTAQFTVSTDEFDPDLFELIESSLNKIHNGL